MKIGNNCLIHSSVLFYGDDIEIGDNTRIDAFSIITGKVRLGRNVHIGCYVFLSGGDGIIIEDFVGISPRVSFFTASDDYSGESMSNPTIPMQFKQHIDRGRIFIGRHTLIGANCVFLPNISIGEGCAIGAFSLIKNDLEPWGMYRGIPAKRFADRSKHLLEIEKDFLKSEQR